MGNLYSGKYEPNRLIRSSFWCVFTRVLRVYTMEVGGTGGNRPRCRAMISFHQLLGVRSLIVSSFSKYKCLARDRPPLISSAVSPSVYSELIAFGAY